MNRLSLAFFSIAPVYGLIGMVWGIVMGASGDHSMFPAHAHLNLLGLVLNGLMGAFYGLAGDRAGMKLGWANFWIFNFAIVWMVPILAIILSGNEKIAPVITVGEVAAVIGLGCFLANILKVGRTLEAARVDAPPKAGAKKAA